MHDLSGDSFHSKWVFIKVDTTTVAVIKTSVGLGYIVCDFLSFSNQLEIQAFPPSVWCTITAAALLLRYFPQNSIFKDGYKTRKAPSMVFGHDGIEGGRHKRQRVAIVGSGLAGLTTAYLLNKGNFDVEIFEMVSGGIYFDVTPRDGTQCIPQKHTRISASYICIFCVCICCRCVCKNLTCS